MNKKNLINGLISLLVIFITSFFTYYAFQGFLTAVVGYLEGLDIFLWGVFNFILLPAFLVFYLRITYQKQDNRRKFLLKNGYFLASVSTLALLFIIYTTLQYTNWGIGITWLFPFDFIVLDIAILVYSIFVIINGYKEPKIDATKPKTKFYKILVIIYMYIFAFVAMDRFGAVISSLINNPGDAFLTLVPAYLSFISCMVFLVSLFIIWNLKGRKHARESLPFVIICGATFIFTTGLNIFHIICFSGDNASDYMRMISPFFGLDRLAATPITIILFGAASSLTPLFFLIDSLIKIIKHKGAKAN